jgi:hypothetical protein
MVVGDRCATIINARPQEEILEGEAVSPRISWISCQLPTWIGVVTHVLCWTHSQILYGAQRFFSLMNVRATEIWCSGQRRIPILRSGCSKFQRMWRYGRVCHQISWLDLILDETLKTASYLAISNAWLKPQLRDRGISRWGNRTLPSSWARRFERTFFQAAGLAVVGRHLWYH